MALKWKSLEAIKGVLAKRLIARSDDTGKSCWVLKMDQEWEPGALGVKTDAMVVRVDAKTKAVTCPKPEPRYCNANRVDLRIRIPELGGRIYFHRAVCLAFRPGIAEIEAAMKHQEKNGQLRNMAK